MLEEGSLPMTVSLIETPERAKFAYFIPYFTQKNYALVRSNLGIKTEEELLLRTKLKVGIIRSYYYGEHYNKLIETLREKRMIVEAKDTERLYDMLKNKWIDVAFNIPSSYLYYFEALDIDDVTVMNWAPEEPPLDRCISISKRFFTEEDVQKFTDAINGMKEDGTLYGIFRKYLPEDEAKRMCDF
jgi:polar amino acid transport system substrate-binding protein